jgi:hypothetical protein
MENGPSIANAASKVANPVEFNGVDGVCGVCCAPLTMGVGLVLLADIVKEISMKLNVYFIDVKVGNTKNQVNVKMNDIIRQS